MAKMRKAVDKREDDIKKKLTAAIMMLLVSCIMVVTSTYAWFTLSTAPEVTGVQTTIGGNGNLEIALATGEAWAIPSDLSVDTDNKDSKLVRNITWGNLIDLSDPAYGLNEIMLNPSALNLSNDRKVNILNFIKTPEYAADGRIDALLPNSVAGTYLGKTEGFQTSGYGVRAVGVSSAMSARQFAFTNAINNISASQSNALTGIDTNIKVFGPILANIAVKYALEPTSTYTVQEITDLRNLAQANISSLSENGINEAIVASIQAFLASEKAKTDTLVTDEQFEGLKETIDSLTYDDLDITFDAQDNATAFTIKPLKDVMTTPITNPAFLSMITKYEKILKVLEGVVNTANGLINSVPESGFTKEQLMTVLSQLMNINSPNVTVAGYTLDYIIANKNNEEKFGEIMATMLDQLNSGINIVLGEGSSVYYDIALLTGDIYSQVQCSVTLKGIKYDKAKANIQTQIPGKALLTALKETATDFGTPSKDTSADVSRIDDTYAYALDLFFRTNATTGSKLLLQTEAVQRIYGESDNINTMGCGSTMIFSSTLPEESMIGLMDAITIVFIGQDADNQGEILGKAKLHSAETAKPDVKETTSSTPVEDSEETTTVENADGTTTVTTVKKEVTKVSDSSYSIKTTTTVTTKYFTKDQHGNIVANLYLVGEDGKLLTGENDVQEIMTLNQNQAHQITALVYLDGEKVTNADVSHLTKSLTGTLNLQFATDAKLEPMKYTGLNQKGEEGNTENTTPEDGNEEQHQG